MLEVGAPTEGTAYADKSLDTLFEDYQKPKSAYFVVEKNDRILGGAGIAPLEAENEKICELQKMYFSPEIRGLGIGTEMMRICLDFARENGFVSCYLETLPFMEAAQKLYRKSGFRNLDHRMGNTGHYSCNVWMILDLEKE